VSEEYAQIVEGCRRGNALAQRKLYDAMAPMAMGICMRYAGNRDEAQDLLQEGMVKVFEKVGRLREPEKLKSWVARVMTNLCIDTIRRRNRSGMVRIEDWDGIEDEVPDHYALDDIVAAMQQLTPQQRLAFNMCVVEGYPYKEASEVLKCEETGTRSLVSRAKARLREILTQQTEERNR